MEISTGGQRFALLLPVTSRGTGGEGVRSLYAVESSLQGFVKVKGNLLILRSSTNTTVVFSVYLSKHTMSHLKYSTLWLALMVYDSCRKPCGCLIGTGAWDRLYAPHANIVVLLLPENVHDSPYILLDKVIDRPPFISVYCCTRTKASYKPYMNESLVCPRLLYPSTVIASSAVCSLDAHRASGIRQHPRI